MELLINIIKDKVNNSFSLDLLDLTIEIDGNSTSIKRHISDYIQGLKPVTKIGIIHKCILSDTPIDNFTLECESVNVICEELIINKLLM